MKKNSISQFAYHQLAAGKSQAETLELVKQAFPGCKTSKAGIAWYASKLKNGKAQLRDEVETPVEDQPETEPAEQLEAA